MKKMVQEGWKGRGCDDKQAYYEWLYSTKAMKIAGNVIAAPRDLERCTVLYEGFRNNTAFLTVSSTFAIDLSQTYTERDSQWFLNPQRGMLKPQLRSYDDIPRRRGKRVARLSIDPLEATRLGSDVLTFNSLPRITRTLSHRLPGHYVFDLFHIPIPPVGNLLFLVNPGSEYSHVELLRCSHGRSIDEHARAVVPALLKAFNSGLSEGDRHGEGVYPPTAPWDWSTPNEALRVALEGELKRAGVRPELCAISVTKPDGADPPRGVG